MVKHSLLDPLQGKNTKTTLLVPVRNEIEGVKLIMPKIDQNGIDEIIVVDGSSTYGTYEYFIEHGYKIVRKKSIGICDA